MIFLPLVNGVVGRRLGVHGHPAHGIDRHSGRCITALLMSVPMTMSMAVMMSLRMVVGVMAVSHDAPSDS